MNLGLLPKFLFSRGDSGGLVVIINEVVGVTSQGNENCVHFPALAVKVVVFKDWIEANKHSTMENRFDFFDLILAGTSLIAVAWLVRKISHKRNTEAKNSKDQKCIEKN